MSTNALTELKKLIVGDTGAKRIVSVVSYDANSGAVHYTSSAGLGTFISSIAYAAGDQLVMDGDKVIGHAEPVTNTVWID